MKQLTKENWLSLDPIIASGVFAKFSMVDGSVEPVTADEWAERFIGVQLSDKVPDSVRELFNVARGAMVYGNLFYPLFTLGLEQVVRVTEAAARAKATSLGIPVTKANGRGRKYFAILKDLAGAGVLSAHEETEWSALRELRNIASHPEKQTIIAPLNVLGDLRRVAEAINRLFR